MEPRFSAWRPNRVTSQIFQAENLAIVSPATCLAWATALIWPAIFSRRIGCRERGQPGAKSRSDAGMVNEVLCKFLCHNLTCLIQEQETPGIVPVFWKDDEVGTAGVMTG